jgi:hypothetical protein
MAKLGVGKPIAVAVFALILTHTPLLKRPSQPSYL